MSWYTVGKPEARSNNSLCHWQYQGSCVARRRARSSVSEGKAMKDGKELSNRDMASGADPGNWKCTCGMSNSCAKPELPRNCDANDNK